jgi:hypothetical protein
MQKMNPYFSIKPGIHEQCHEAFTKADDTTKADMLRAVELAVLCQQERSTGFAARVRPEKIEARSAEAAVAKFLKSQKVSEAEFFVNWPVMRRFLDKYWAHSPNILPKIDDCSDAILRNETFKGTTLAGSDSFVALSYRMAEEWAKRMQIRLRFNKDTPMDVVAEASFQEAFANCESDNPQMVREVAGQYLSAKWSEDKKITDAFKQWFSTHRQVPMLPAHDPECRHTEGMGWEAIRAVDVRAAREHSAQQRLAAQTAVATGEASGLSI